MSPAARGVLGPAVLTALLAVAWLIVDPSSIDLAAQEYRAELFRDEGFVAESPDWYGGFDVPGYSLLFPPLGAWLGVSLLGALAAVAAAALFALIADRYAGQAGRLAAYWFAIGIVSQLVNGRVTFTLGVAIGLAAVAAIQARRPVAAAVGGALTSAASPVSGVFLALAGAASARAAGIAAAGGAAIVAAIMALAWPTDGYEPFATSAFLAIPLFVAAGLLVVPASMRPVRLALLLYGVLAVGVFAIDNPLGSNVTRLGALFGGPVLALALWPQLENEEKGQKPKTKRLALAVLAVPLLYWQWTSAVDALIRATPDPLRDASRTEPLLRQIERRAVDAPSGFRVHVPPTETRWEAVHVAERFPIARGWLRQLESDDFDLFQHGNLTPSLYREWLADHRVAFVAVPDAPADYLAEDERSLIAAGLPYLENVWSNPYWALYRVGNGS